ncbi:hypothetical protein ATN84_09115 [Paramesorhizobium deserti]|uniref:Esterase n=1 Tax=Paramesorhizobium deserti TaxID=1494590 RepID=A0A135HWE1_9HYPH|nr:alpha/beta hydrolase-fold protein [Paramesorhizobium deserti]KXF77519.1 hypothetical protein ATN84_09115 [Paramesorhizobium deserti]
MHLFDVAIAAFAFSLFASGAAEAKRVKWSDCDPGGIQSLSVPDPVSGRSYNVEISLPSGYDHDASTRYPIIYLADGDRGTRPVACQIRELYEKGTLAEEPVLVGLSYAKGENLDVSRKRDYTPVPRKPGDTAYGGAEAYQRYLRRTVIPFVESRYRANPDRRIYLGHSYGGLLGARILLTEPDLFHTYILGSPSIWFANHAILRFEADYAKANRDLKADVLLFVGGDEVSRYDPGRGGNTQDMVGDMRAFESRLQQRGYQSLTINSLVVPGKNHRKVFPPGLTWAITAVLGRATPR